MVIYLFVLILLCNTNFYSRFFTLPKLFICYKFITTVNVHRKLGDRDSKLRTSSQDHPHLVKLSETQDKNEKRALKWKASYHNKKIGILWRF